MPASVGTVFVDVRFNVGAAAKELQRTLAASMGGATIGAAPRALERTWAQSLGAIGAKAATVGKQMTVGLTLPMALIGKAAVEAYAEFDTAMTQIGAINQINAETTNQWRTEVVNLGNEYGIAAEEAAQGLYFITSSGIEAGRAIEVLNIAMQASAVGLGETKVVADVLTSALSAYSKQGLTAAQAADQLTAAVRQGKGEADELAGSLSQVIPIAANLGVSFGEVTGAMAAMTLSGTSSDQAATQLRGLFNTLQDMPPIAQRALKQYTGLDYAATRLALKNEGLIPTLKAIYDGFGGQTEAMAEVFGNIRALTGIFNLFGDNTEQTLKIVNQTMKASGDLSEAWAKTAESDAKKLDRAMNQAHAGLVGLGEEIIPVMTGAAEAVGVVGKAFGTLPDPLQNTIVAFGSLAAVAGPAVFIFGKMAQGVAGLGTALTTLSPTLARAGTNLQTRAALTDEAIKGNTKLTKTFGSLNSAVAGIGATLALGTLAWSLWQQAMEKAEAAAKDAAQWSQKGSSGSIDAGTKQLQENHRQLAAINADIEEWNRQRGSMNPADVGKAIVNRDWIEQRKKEGEALQADSERIERHQTIARGMAQQTNLNADAFVDWLAVQENAGHKYTKSEDALLAYNKALEENDTEALKVAQSSLKASNSIGGIIAKAKQASEAFFAVAEATDAREGALKGLADAQQGVKDAEEAWADSKKKILDADRKISDSQRKATEATLKLKEARLGLADAEKELADARSGPSEDEKLNLESAKISVQEARKRLSGDFEDPLDRRKARIDYRRAQLDLERVKGEHGKRIEDAEKGVADARGNVADALQAQVDANQAIVDATDARTAAGQNERKAYEEIAGAQEAVRDAEYELYKATVDLAGVQDNLNQLINAGTIKANDFYQMMLKLKELYPEMAPYFDAQMGAFGDAAVANAPPPVANPWAPENRLNLPKEELIYNADGTWTKIRRAAGGPVSAGQTAMVNERGMPELWSAGGKQFLLPTTNGQVTPLKPLDVPITPKGSDGVTIGGDIIVQGASQPVATAYEVRRQLRQKTRTGGRD
jgi:TP901 family phage tail tape measure protein